jgi:hypothetical protein
MSTSQNGGGDATAQTQAELQRLMSRAATDQDFRTRLLTTPREAMGEFYGREIPSTVDIRFVENTADATFVLPDAIDPAAELNDAELEAVAGGSEILATIALAISIAHVIKTIGDDDKWLS